MAYEGPPDACVLPFTAVQTFLLTFEVDMDTSFYPPGDRWTATHDISVFTYHSQNWIDLHDLEVNFSYDIHPVPGTFDIFYGPLHPDLRTHFGTAYPEFEILDVPTCV